MIDSRTIEDFVAGKESGFSVIYNKYSPGMYAICCRYLRSKDDADDVLQEAFIKIYNARKSFDKSKPIGAWIKTITIRTALDFIKKKKTFNDYLNQEREPLFTTEDYTSNESNHNFKDSLLNILKEIPEGYSTIFQLYVLDNLTHKEIAEYLGISEGTSKSQYSHAKKAIKRKLKLLKVAG